MSGNVMACLYPILIAMYDILHTCKGRACIFYDLRLHLTSSLNKNDGRNWRKEGEKERKKCRNERMRSQMQIESLSDDKGNQRQSNVI